jgi:nicotinate phosphoribosyltransferase
MPGAAAPAIGAGDVSSAIRRGGADGGVGGRALFTDLYELTMLQAYWRETLTDTAVFSLHVRALPAQRNYLLACGLADALEALERLCFEDDDLAYLRTSKLFGSDFIDWLRAFRFTGSVYAVPEGTPVFAHEPLLEVVAPIGEAQLAETLLMNQVHLQTLLASKAARVVHAAAGRRVVDFGMRRMHGYDAALKAARAFYVAGVDATSNVLAGARYGIPIAGTMAHSYVQAHATELDAFRAFARLYPDTTLLVDTYDTIEGVHRVVALLNEAAGSLRVGAIRLDSGDIAALALEARRILDAAGHAAVRIFASGGLDEEQIARLLAAGAPIDGFGVGTRMGVPNDVPALDIAYKLTEYAGRGRLKLSPGKPILPGRKQVFRVEDGGRAVHDVIALAGEAPAGRPLLRRVMKDGVALPAAREALTVLRARAAEELARLPDAVTQLAPMRAGYPVHISAALQRLRDELAGTVRA